MLSDNVMREAKGLIRESIQKYLNAWSRILLLQAVSFILVFFSASDLLAGPIYVFREPDGVIRFSNRPPPKGVSAKVFTAKDVGFSTYRVRRRPFPKLNREKYKGLVNIAARKYQLSPHLIRAVIHVESAFNPHAVSPKGALGLMQLMPFNLRLLGIKQPFSPQQNIFAGSKWLARLHKRYKGNVRLALAAYNAGEKAVEKYNGIPPYRETQNYVRRVLELEQRYQRGA